MWQLIMTDRDGDRLVVDAADWSSGPRVRIHIKSLNHGEGAVLLSPDEVRRLHSWLDGALREMDG